MDVELKALKENNTWELTRLTIGKQAIERKRVHKLKFLIDGTLERCKSRVVAKGYKQRKGIDYIEITSPMSKLTTIRVFLTFIASQN